MSLGHGYRKQTTLNTGKGKEKPSSHCQLKLLHAMHMSIDLFKWGFKSFWCRFQFAGLKHKIIQDGGDFCWCCLSSCCLWIDVDNEELHIVAAYDKIAISGVGSCNFSPPFNFYCYGKYSKIQDFSQLNCWVCTEVSVPVVVKTNLCLSHRAATKHLLLVLWRITIFMLSILDNSVQNTWSQIYKQWLGTKNIHMPFTTCNIIFKIQWESESVCFFAVITSI